MGSETNTAEAEAPPKNTETQVEKVPEKIETGGLLPEDSQSLAAMKAKSTEGMTTTVKPGDAGYDQYMRQARLGDVQSVGMKSDPKEQEKEKKTEVQGKTGEGKTLSIAAEAGQKSQIAGTGERAQVGEASATRLNERGTKRSEQADLITSLEGNTISVQRNGRGEVTQVTDSNRISKDNPGGIWRPEFKGAYVDEKGHYGYKWNDPADKDTQYKFELDTGVFTKSDKAGRPLEIWTGLNDKSLRLGKDGGVSLLPGDNSEHVAVKRAPDGSITELKVNNSLFVRDKVDNSKWTAQEITPILEKNGVVREQLGEKSELFQMKVRLDDKGLSLQQGDTTTQVRSDGSKLVTRPGSITSIDKQGAQTIALTDEQGAIKQVNTPDGGIYRKIGQTGNESEPAKQEQWVRLGSKDAIPGNWSVSPESGGLKFSGVLPAKEGDLAGVTYKRDAQGRTLETSSNNERRTFEYKEGLAIPSAYTQNDRRFELDQKSLKDGIPVYVEKVEKGEGQRVLGAPDRDGNIRSFDPEKRATVILKPDGNTLSHYENGAFTVQGRDGKISETVDASGVRRSYQYGQVEGQKDPQLNSVETFNPATKTREKLTTTDGFNWKVETQKGAEEPVQSQWRGLIQTDQQSGSLLKTGSDAKVEVSKLSGESTTNSSFDLEARAKEIQKLFDNPKQKDAVNGILSQLQDLDSQQTRLLAKRLETDNPNLGGIDKIIAHKLKDQPGFKQLEVQLNFNRTGKPGEAAAIQLTVDAAEFKEAMKNSWFSKTRSSEEITRSMRHLLGSSSEAERQHIDTAMKDIHGGRGLKEFFQGGDAKEVFALNDYQKKFFSITSEAGVDKRTPEQQAELMRAALGVNNLNMSQAREERFLYFTEAASVGFSTEAGRKAFRDHGGIDAIKSAFTSKDGYAKKYIDEANDFAKLGETERLREFRRGFGLTGNAQKSMELALASIPLKERLQLADGMAMTMEGREARTPEEKLAVSKFQEFKQAAGSANWLFNKNNTLRYLDQSLREGGTDISKILSQAPLFFPSAKQGIQLVDQMDRKTMEQLLVGRQNDSSPYQKQYLEALSTALGRGEAFNSAVARLKQKVDAVSAIDKAAESASGATDAAQAQRALNELKSRVPALQTLPAEKWDSLVAGFMLSKQIEKNQKPVSELSADESQKLLQFQGSALKAILEGNKLSQSIRTWEADSKFLERAQKGTLDAAELKAAGLDAAQAKELANTSLYARHEALLSRLSPAQQESLKLYQSILLDSSKPGFDQVLAESKGTPASLLQNLRALNPADPAFKRPAQELYQQLDKYLDSKTVEGFTARLLLESKINSTGSAKDKLLSFSAELLTDKALNGGIDQRELSNRLGRFLQADKDGAVFALLKTDQRFQDALNVVFSQDRKAAKEFLDAYSESGRLSGAQLSQLYYGKNIDDNGFFRASVLDASPQALRFLADDKNPKAVEERKLLMFRFAENGWDGLAEKIIKAGEVRPEHLIRAAILQTGVSTNEALNVLSRLDETARRNALDNYFKEFGSQARADWLKADGSKNADAIKDATKANDLSAIQTQIAKQKEAFSTDTGLGADLAKLYSRSHLDELSRYQQARRLAGGELSGEKLKAAGAKLEEAIKTFKDTKKETIDAYVNGVLMIGGLAAPPLIGFTSLAELSAATKVLMLTGAGTFSAGSKALLKGNDESSLREIVGNFAEGALIFGTSFVGPEYAARMHGLGSKTALGAVERGFSKMSATELAELEAAGVKKSVSEQMKTMIAHNLAYGQNVSDDAVLKMVAAIPNVADATRAKLAASILQGLKEEIPAQASLAVMAAMTASKELKALGVMMETGAATGALVEGSNQIIKEQHLDVGKLLTVTATSALMAGVISVPLRGLSVLSRNAEHATPREMPTSDRGSAPRTPDSRHLPGPETARPEPARPWNPHDDETPRILPQLQERYPNASREELLAKAEEIKKVALAMDSIRMYSFAEDIALGLHSPEFEHLNNSQRVALGKAIDHDAITLAELKQLSRKDLDALTKGFAVDDSLPVDIAKQVGEMYPWQQHAARIAWQQERGRRGFKFGEDKAKVAEELAANFRTKFDELVAAGPEALLKKHPDVLTAIKQYHPDLGSTASVPLDAQSKEALNIVAAHVISQNIHGEGRAAAIRKFSSKQFVEALEALDPGLKRLKAVAESLNNEPSAMLHRHPALENYWEGHGALGLQSVFGKQWKQWLDLHAGSMSKEASPAEIAQAVHDNVHWLPIAAPGELDGLGPWLMRNARTPVNARKFAPISEDELAAAKTRKVEAMRLAGRDENAIANESNLTRREIGEEEERLAGVRADKYRASKQEALARGETTPEKIETELAAAEKGLALERQRAQKSEDMGVVARRWHELSPEQRKFPFKDLVAAARAQHYLDSVSPEFAAESAKWGVPRDQFAAIEARFLLSQKTPSPFPVDKSWESGEYVGRFIPRSDVRGLYLGQYSACCQHPFDAGRTSAWHGQENPNGGFFIVTRKDNPNEIVAQSWAYKSKDGGLVFDSIESKQIKLLEESLASVRRRGDPEFVAKKQAEIDALRKAIAGSYEGAAKDLSQSQFQRVTVGTRYGRFSHYESWPQAGDRSLQLPHGYSGYSDAFDQAGQPMQRLLAENKDIAAKESGAPRPWVRAAESPAAAKAEAERIAKEVFPEGWQFSSEGNLTLLLEGDKAPVGYAVLDTKNRSVTDLAVLEQNRRHSKVLLDAILDYAERTGKEWTAAGARDSTSKVLLEYAAKSGRIEIISSKEVNGTLGADKRYDIVFKVKPRVKAAEQAKE